jgi:stalled ribosome rescue protein Dom34
MSGKNKKQFGVWMDTHRATVVGRDGVDTGNFVIIGHAKNNGAGSNSNENASNNLEKTLQLKFFKEIMAYMKNVDEVHVTGTGTVQEQFINYIAEAPQYKNTVAKESTSNKMDDWKLVEYIADKFN